MKKIFYFFLWILTIPVFAQDQTRIEFDLDEAIGDYKMYPAGSDGILLGYHPKEKGNSGNYRILKLDLDFKKKNTLNLPIKKGYNILESVDDGQNLYLLMAKSSYFKEYSIFKISHEDMKFTHYDGIYKKELNYDFFKVMNGRIFLASIAGPSRSLNNFMMCISMPLCFIPLIFYNPSYYPYIAEVDMNKKVPSLKEYAMENYRKVDASFLNLAVDDSLNLVDIMLKIQNKKDSRTIIRQIKDQKLEKEVLFKMGGGKDVKTADIFNMDANQKIVFGMFKNKETYSKRKKSSGTNSAAGGIFISSIENGKQTFTKMVPFNSFKNFKLSIMGKSDKPMRSGKKKRMEKYDDAFQSTIGMSFHPLLVREDEILVFAEPYYPVYHTVTTTTRNANGTTTTTTTTVFDGYQFFGAMVMAFDMQGNMKWENGFKINGPLSFSLAHKFDFYEMEDGGIKVLYGAGSMVYSKVIYNDKIDTERELIKLKTSPTDKKVWDVSSRVTEKNGIEYWYENYYLAYGVQKIKSDGKNSSSKKNRNIYYLTKLEVEK